MPRTQALPHSLDSQRRDLRPANAPATPAMADVDMPSGASALAEIRGIAGLALGVTPMVIVLCIAVAPLDAWCTAMQVPPLPPPGAEGHSEASRLGVAGRLGGYNMAAEALATLHVYIAHRADTTPPWGR